MGARLVPENQPNTSATMSASPAPLIERNVTVGGHADDGHVGDRLAGNEVQIGRGWLKLPERPSGNIGVLRRVGDGDVHSHSDRTIGHAGGSGYGDVKSFAGAYTLGRGSGSVTGIKYPRRRDAGEVPIEVANDVDEDLSVSGFVPDVDSAIGQPDEDHVGRRLPG